MTEKSNQDNHTYSNNTKGGECICVTLTFI